jgi:TPR repeat protein
MKTIFKALFVLIALSAVPVFAQSDFEAVKARAEVGNAASQFELGYLYDRGEGVNQNYAEAARWYRSAAQQNHIGAQYNLGVMFANGRGLTQNDQEAVKWYSRAAEQGNVLAQKNLGFFYESGRGVEKNDQEAFKWYRSAAEQRDAEAQNAIAVMYTEGRGIAQNYQEALKWFTLAAGQGLADAQNNIGNMYLEGRGVAQNDQEAQDWFTLAAENDIEPTEAEKQRANRFVYPANQQMAARAKAERDAEEARIQVQARERERIERERVEEERRQFLATPEGQRQLAEQAERQRQQLAAQAERQRVQREAREREARAENERIAREFPYYAVLSCGIFDHMTMTACMLGDYTESEINLTNGSEQNIWTLIRYLNGGIPNSRETREGLRIELKNTFGISMRNVGSENIVLGIKIYDRRTGNIVYQEEKGRFGTISVRN